MNRISVFLLLLLAAAAFASEPRGTVYYPAMVWTESACFAMGVPCTTGVMAVIETTDPSITAYRLAVNYTDANGEARRKAVLVDATSFQPGSLAAATAVWVPMPRDFRYVGIAIKALQEGPDVKPYQK